jgi:hypothetical protein
VQPFERQQFDLLLTDGVGRLAERATYRCGGHEAALQRLREDPEGEGVWLHEFTRNLMTEMLLDDVAGACFVLQALARRRVTTAVPAGAPVADVLAALATDALAELLRAKTIESLEQPSGVVS